MMRVAGLVLASMLLTTTAFAQSTSNSNSSSTSASQSGASITNNAPSVVTTRGRLDTTNSAFAPGLTAAGINSCAGSVSAGGAGTGFNFGIGGTYEMEQCTHRANAAALAGLGQQLAALEELCQSDSMRRSLNASGTICPSQRAEYAAAQARANETGQMYIAPELVEQPPVVRNRVRRTRYSDRRRVAVDAQAARSDNSVSQQAANAVRR